MSEQNQLPVLIEDIADTECGPAMRKCTPLMRKFIAALYECGVATQGSQTRAALMANPGYSRDVARAMAGRWMMNPTVLAGLKEYTDLKFQGAGVIGYKALIEIASDASPANTGHRVKAALALLDRAGHAVETIQRHIHEHDIPQDTKSLLAEIKALAQDPDVRKAIESGVIDGEFAEVDPLEGLYA